jgi:hypothetical protein
MARPRPACHSTPRSSLSPAAAARAPRSAARSCRRPHRLARRPRRPSTHPSSPARRPARPPAGRRRRPTTGPMLPRPVAILARAPGRPPTPGHRSPTSGHRPARPPSLRDCTASPTTLASRPVSLPCTSPSLVASGGSNDGGLAPGGSGGSGRARAWCAVGDLTVVSGGPPRRERVEGGPELLLARLVPHCG